MYEHLIEFYNKKKHNIKRYHENSSEATEIRSLTSFLDDSGLFSKIGYKQRIWHIINNQLSLKTCVICNKPVRWDDGNKRYSDTCCKECFLEYSKSDIVKEKIKQTNIQKYGAESYSQTEEGKLKQQQTCLEKYGVDNPAKADDYNEKSKKTCLCKYGVDNSAKIVDYKEKSKKTCLQKYGVENINQIPEIKEKQKESYKKTCLKRYGVISTSQLPEVKEKMRTTIKKQFGVDNYSQTDEFKEKSKKTCLKRYGTEYYQQADKSKEKLVPLFLEKLKNKGYHKKGYRIISYKGGGDYELYCPNCKQNFIINYSDQFYHRHTNKHEICTICNPLKREYSYGEKEVLFYISSIYDGVILENDRTVIKPKELDIYLPELHLAIEYNGDYWHANPKYYSSNHIIGDVPAKTVWKEDKQKINRCIKAGIELLIIWEDDWINHKEQVQFELNSIITELTDKSHV